MKIVVSSLFALCLTSAVAQQPPSDMIFPGATWKYEIPAKVGWSESKLETAKEYFESLNADACVIVVNGRLLASWGEESEVIDGRSMRKFFLGSLFGIASGKGQVDVSKTLKEIGINEKTPLTEQELQATVANLLTSSSGIYLPASYEAPNMSDGRPARGSNPPGKAFYYNNWDFNALSTVYEKETGAKVFEAFENQIAKPLQMQDFDLEHTRYIFEDQSEHPAYIIESSARDDARLGLLWLNKGSWSGKQIIPEAWVEEATKAQFTFTNPNRFKIRDGYGYLTWLDHDAGGKLIGYSALGNSGQYMYVSIEHQAVIVLRADPGSVFKKWFGLRLDPTESYRLIDLVLDAAE